MVCFTKLALTIAIAIKPICANEMPDFINEIIGFADNKANTGVSEDVDSFKDENKDKSNEERAIIKFNEIINEDLFPEKMEGAKKLLKDKDYSKLEDFILNNISNEKYNGGDALNKLSGAMYLARHSSELDMSSFEESVVMMATNVTSAQVDNATKTIKTLIEDDVVGDKQQKAKALLEKKDYDALEDFVLKNLDNSELIDYGDEKSTNILTSLSRAMTVLHASARRASNTTVSNPVSNTTVSNSTMLQDSDFLEESMVMDSLANEEETLSILRSSITKTEEEIEELISRLNEN